MQKWVLCSFIVFGGSWVLEYKKVYVKKIAIYVNSVMSDVYIQYEGWGWVTNTVRDEAECYVWHKTPSQVLYFLYLWANGALTDLLFAQGGLVTVVAMN